MIRIILAFAAFATSLAANASEKLLPPSVTIINEEQAKACKFLDLISAMRFALMSASKSQHAALDAALVRAEKAGANAAVIKSLTVDHNQHQVTLAAYNCDAPISHEN